MSTTQPGPYQSQGQPAYQTPGGPAVVPPPPAGPPARQRNTLAVVALVLAVLGFIFAVMEGAYILGWILLPVAFVLSLVALVQKYRPRKMAVAALVISIVGTIGGGIAFMASTARIIDDSFGSEATVVATPSQSEAAVTEEAVAADATDDAAGESTPVADAAAQGTRQNPLPLGTAVATDEWEITVNSFTPDATAEVLAENQFNEEPTAGTAYALANVTLTRVAAESGTAFEVSIAYVTAGGNVVTSTDAMVVAPDELGYDELYQGASITGNVALAIPAGDAGTVRVTPGLFADDVFFAAS